MALLAALKDFTNMATNSLNWQAFENTSTSVAASQMRNSLNTLTDTVKDPAEKKVWHPFDTER
jgi:hypothetical protein